MSVKRYLKLQQKGDTIVEVMIVLAILGLALGISYRTAVRSLLATREAQENSEATQLLQSQVELLYSLVQSANPAQNIFNNSTVAGFCVNTLTSPISVQARPSAACQLGSQSYDITILYCSNGNLSIACAGHPADDTFILTAKWANVRGQGQDQVMLTYRIRKLS